MKTSKIAIKKIFVDVWLIGQWHRRLFTDELRKNDSRSFTAELRKALCPFSAS